MQNNPNFPGLLERFFTQRLMAQRQASPHTIASYRDTFRLLLEFVQKQSHKAPSKMALTDLDPPLIGAFLDQLEKQRGNSARSRNLRLTAIRSFFHYAAFEEPAQSALIQRVQRSFRPFPTHRRWAPLPSTTSPRRRLIISERRKPV